MAIRDMLLPEFDQETANTRKMLERVPDDRLAWKPHEKSMSMTHLASHIANILDWGMVAFEKDSFDVAPPGGPQYRVEDATSREALLAQFDKNRAAARAALAQVTDEQFMQPWTLLSGGKPIFTMPRVAVYRSMIMNHGIHHRAQLSVYLRLNDVPVPGMYGPSADEKK
jgi:uncharacterized damage-inducible protein DinB